MSRGYLVIAQNSGELDYLRQAYGLALSIKLTQSAEHNISVCVDEVTEQHVTHKHRKIFDHIIKIPWTDHARNHSWKIQNKWKYLHMTPYDETVVLDTDMVFPGDVSNWWDILGQKDFWVTTRVKTYRNDVVTSDYYRKVFTANKLPNIYTAFWYFKKSEITYQIFELAQFIFNNWEKMFWEQLTDHRPDHLSGDVAFALAIKLLDMEHLTTCVNTDMPTFVHMKSHIQNIDSKNISDNWYEWLPTYWQSITNFKIGNFQQTLPFHYQAKEWLTDDMIHDMEMQHGRY